MSTIRYIVAQNVDALCIELARLPSGETAYITAHDYKRITEEDLDEFSTVGRKMIAEIAAGAKCAVRIEGGRKRARRSSDQESLQAPMLLI